MQSSSTSSMAHCRPMRLRSIVTAALCSAMILLGTSVSPVAADLHTLCPTGYSGFVVADLCTRVVWCSEGMLNFHQTCDEGMLFDATRMACRSDADYTCPTNSPTFRPTISANPTANPTASPTPAPTKSPVTPSPTASPTLTVSSSPSKAPVSPAPTDAPVTSSPTSDPSKAPVTDSPTTAKPSAAPVSPAPTDAPVSSAPTDAPTLAPVSGSPTGAVVLSAVAAATDPPPTNVPPTAVPAYEPVTVITQGTRFEVAISGLPTYLFHKAFAELNNILDGMIVSNLNLAVGIEDIQFNTILISQGIKRRDVSEETTSVSPLTNTLFYPAKSTIVARPSPQQYEKHISDDFKPPMLRRRLGEEEEEDSVELLKVTRDLQGGATLFAILQKKIYVTVPGTGPSGQHDESLIPSQFELNGAISSVFKDATQKALFASWLRASSVQAFTDVEQVDFVGFVDESWTQPDFNMSMEPIVVQTHWESPSV